MDNIYDSIESASLNIWHLHIPPMLVLKCHNSLSFKPDLKIFVFAVSLELPPVPNYSQFLKVGAFRGEVSCKFNIHFLSSEIIICLQREHIYKIIDNTSLILHLSSCSSAQISEDILHFMDFFHVTAYRDEPLICWYPHAYPGLFDLYVTLILL